MLKVSHFDSVMLEVSRFDSVMLEVSRFDSVMLEVSRFDSVMLEVYYRLQIFVIMSGFEMQIFCIQNRYENLMAWSGIHSLCKKVAVQTHLQLQEF